MDVSISDRIRGFVALAASTALLGGVLSCVTTAGTPGDESGAPEVLSDVWIHQDGGATRVDLMGAQDAVFTSFEREEPTRLIVDLTSMTAEGLASPIPSYDDFVTEVSVSGFSADAEEPTTRVEIVLASRAEYEFVREADRLAVRLSPAAELVSELGPFEEEETQAEDSLEEDPWADTETWPSFDADMEDASMPPASTLLGIEVEDTDAATVVHLYADGSLAERESFTLDSPTRIVIDLPNLMSSVAASKIEVATAQLSHVRIGQHEDKVRIVLDALDTDPASSHWVTPTRDGLRVTVGGPDAAPAERAEDTAMGMPDAEGGEVAELYEVDEDEMAEAMAEDAEVLAGSDEMAEDEDPWVAEMQPTGPTQVYGVQFDAQPDRDRVVVASATPVEYTLYEPDDQTLVVSLPNTVIDPDAAAQLAARSGWPDLAGARVPAARGDDAGGARGREARGGSRSADLAARGHAPARLRERRRGDHAARPHEARDDRGSRSRRSGARSRCAADAVFSGVADGRRARVARVG
jgi:hypothetical protein